MVFMGQIKVRAPSRKLWEMKLPKLNSQMLALHENGVEFRQQFNGAIKNSLTTSHYVL